MKTYFLSIALLFCLLLGISEITYSQDDDVYDQGTVWSLTFIRTGANVADDYLKDLTKTWKASMDEALKEGLIVSYKVLLGAPANEEDYNIVLMIENENMAVFDYNPERDAKFDAIQKKVAESMEGEFDGTVKNYENLRKLYGTKLMREIYLK
ncbi:MAG: hypothetical protein WBG58_20335 [Ignavibacteriaceae bacterium]